MSILRQLSKQHSGTNGINGLLTHEKNLISDVQVLILSGESTQTGNIEVEHGEVVAIQSQMMNHSL